MQHDMMRERWRKKQRWSSSLQIVSMCSLLCSLSSPQGASTYAFQPAPRVSRTTFPLVETAASCPCSLRQRATRLQDSSVPVVVSAVEEQVILSQKPVDPNDTRYSASDWWHNIQSLPRSTILREIRNPVLTIVVWSAVVSLLHSFLLVQTGRSWRQSNSMFSLSSKPHSLLVSSLGLLLVFRTNSAYQRFREGRRIWERILAVSRNMSRLTVLYGNEVGEARLDRILRLLAAFPYLLRKHVQPKEYRQNEQLREKAVLTEPDSTNGAIRRQASPWCLLPARAVRRCIASPNRPLWVCDRLSEEVNNVGYTDNFTSRERLTFLTQIGKLSDSVGECERIHQTAVPLNYARHSLRSLTFWLFTLPFCLVDELRLLTAPVMGAIAWLMLGVYQIGYTIEDPFQGSLRLKVLCDAIYRDVMSDGRNGLLNRQSAFEIDSEELKEWRGMPPEPRQAFTQW